MIAWAPPPATIQDAPEGDEIVVNGAALSLKVRLAIDGKGRVRACSIDTTSGDAGFDRAACEATVACARQGLREPAAMRVCASDKMAAYVPGNEAATPPVKE